MRKLSLSEVYYFIHLKIFIKCSQMFISTRTGKFYVCREEYNAIMKMNKRLPRATIQLNLTNTIRSKKIRSKRLQIV